MEKGKKRLATLVGCNYPNTRNELHGCINDAHAMRDLLVNRFGFKLEDIEVLTDEPGAPAKPTGRNIRRKLDRMVARAEPGDVLFFHYSGHGTLIPSVKPHHQGSKRDEAIVPCDFNLITNVDFRQLVDRLPAGVSFTIISDSCHSGGLIDQEKEQIGPSTTTNRALRAEQRRLIPFESVLDQLAALTGIESTNVADHLLQLFGADTSPKFLRSRKATTEEEPAAKSDAGILLSGCQSDETSADMSPEDEPSKAYGAFSNSLQIVLAEHDAALSNRELVTLARRELKKQGFTQHPCLYCSDENADAPFLWQPPAPFLLQPPAPFLLQPLVEISDEEDDYEEDEDEDVDDDDDDDDEDDDDPDYNGHADA